jgi:hypothetical protein
MNLLVATRETQGEFLRDEFTCRPGELVFPNLCDQYDDCAHCERLFRGADTLGVTTTAQLANVDITLDDLRAAVRRYAVPGTSAEVVDLLIEDLVWPSEQPDITLGCIVRRAVDRHGDATLRVVRR